jgi:hypothetical protein
MAQPASRSERKEEIKKSFKYVEIETVVDF